MRVHRPETAKYHTRKLCDQGLVRETCSEPLSSSGRQPVNRFDITNAGQQVLATYGDAFPGDGFEARTERRIERLEEAVESLQQRVDELEDETGWEFDHDG